MACRVPFKDVETVIRCLEEDGGVILSDFTEREDVQTVNDDAAPYIDAVAKERESKGQPRGTVRCHRLFGRSQTAREKWLQRPEVHLLLDHFLGTSSVPYNEAGACAIKTSAILSSSATLEISPGEKAQGLHRDDFIWQKTHPRERKTHDRDPDLSLALLVPGTKTTHANGATAFVPKSHLWSHSRRPEPEEIRYAEMDIGDAFVFLGSMVHGGGTNMTQKSRTVHGFFYCRSWLRPEENQFLWWTKDEVAKWSTTAQKQVGYLLDNPFLGHCDEVDPLGLFRSSEPLAERRAA